jgi:hypothetical protein
VVACCISAINLTNHATTNHTVRMSHNKKIFRKDYLYCSLFGVRGRLGCNSMFNGPGMLCYFKQWTSTTTRRRPFPNRRSPLKLQHSSDNSINGNKRRSSIPMLEFLSLFDSRFETISTDSVAFRYYVDPFSIRDSRGLVPTQLPPGIMSILTHKINKKQNVPLCFIMPSSKHPRHVKNTIYSAARPRLFKYQTCSTTKSND